MAINLGSLGDLAINLNNSAAKIRKELVYMPIIGCKTTLQHATLRPGLRSNETVGQVAANVQFGPYSNSYKDSSNININPRTLEVFMGSLMKEFDPNEVASTIWGSDYTKGPEMTNAEIVGKIVPYLMAQAGKNLNAALWSASRDSSGHTAATLFNGWDTIAAAEATAAATTYSTAVAALVAEHADASAAEKAAAGNAAVVAAGKGLHASLGNYADISADYATAMGANGDVVAFLQGFVQNAADELQGIEVEGADAPKLFIPYDLFNKYNKDYAAIVGPQLYNKEYTKHFVEGTNVELVPLVNKKGSKFITLSTKSNMLVGCNQMGEEETCTVEKVPGLSLMLTATLFWGTQFESISKERLYVGQILQ